MVLTINPVVYGKENRGQWRRCAFLHIVGGALGGAMLWSLASAVLHLLNIPQETREILAVIVLLAGGLIDVQVFPIWIPTTGRQVPQSLRYRASREWVAFRYGFELGMGITTRVSFAITYSSVVVSSLLLDVRTASLCGVAYGVARSLIVIRGRKATNQEEVTQRAIGFLDKVGYVRFAVLVGTMAMIAIVLFELSTLG